VIRVGIGYDVHRLVRGRRLVLGGVGIPGEFGLEGHSDADVLLHAIGDALLGAAGLGDLGRYFPPSDERWRDAPSTRLVQEIVQLLASRGWFIVNVDATLVAEWPRLAPFREEMRARTAQALGLPLERVGLKATTNEGLGFVGRGEGVAALAVALVADERVE
jgi:2-C-methyl-D-erythritol 2,4-cyclodiphosphate synthase